MQGVHEVTDYERQRDAQVADNDRMLQSLGIIGLQVRRSTAREHSNNQGRASRETGDFQPVRRSNRQHVDQDTRQPTTEQIAQWIYNVCEQETTNLNGYGQKMGQVVLDTGLAMHAIKLLVDVEEPEVWEAVGVQDPHAQRLIHQSFGSLVDTGLSGLGGRGRVMGSTVEIQPGNLVLVSRAIDMYRPMKARVLRVDKDTFKVEFTHEEFITRRSMFCLRPGKLAFIGQHEIVEVLA